MNEALPQESDEEVEEREVELDFRRERLSSHFGVTFLSSLEGFLSPEFSILWFFDLSKLLVSIVTGCSKGAISAHEAEATIGA